jgi:hypothetical protein
VTKLHSCRSRFLVLARRLATSCLAVCCFASAQGYDYPNQEVRISDLPSLTAQSRNASDVLATSLEIIFRDKDVCCRKNSTLEDRVQSADPMSLKDVGNKLQGRHVLSDGRPIMVTAEYVPAASVNADQLISAIIGKSAPLMEWDSRLYVVYGVIFDVTVDNSTGGKINAIRKLLLLDTRFSDARREVAYNRLSDDWGKVQGLLLLKAAAQ